MFNPAILSVDGANQFHRSNKAALCRTKENILCLVLIFGDCLRFLMFFFSFLLICFYACFFFLLPLCFFFTCCLFRYLPGSGNEGMNPQGVFFREGPAPSMHPNVYPSSSPRTSNPTFYQHHRFTSSHHQPPPPQYGTLHHQGATRHQPPPNVTVETVSIMSVFGFLFGTGCSRQS